MKKAVFIPRKLAYDVPCKCIVGLIFFTTVIGVMYLAIITDFIVLLETDEYYVWFQQDGSPADKATNILSFLHEFFDDRLISKELWTPRSPDLSPPDFILWGYLKNSVFREPLAAILELKTRITEKMNEQKYYRMCLETYSN